MPRASDGCSAATRFGGSLMSATLIAFLLLLLALSVALIVIALGDNDDFGGMA